MNNSQRDIFAQKKMSDHTALADFAIGMAYVPWQKSFDNIYDTDKAFCTGTIFSCLDKPFLGRGGCK